MEYLMFIIGSFGLAFMALYYKDCAKREETTRRDLERDYRRLKAGTRSLIWNLGNQTEKVPGNIQQLLPIVHGEVSEDMAFEVDKKIKNLLYRS
jgi:hypothetical protein